MRDIRSDLEERASIVQEQIRGAYAARLSRLSMALSRLLYLSGIMHPLIPSSRRTTTDRYFRFLSGLSWQI
jgi:hypothetical protein